MLTCAPSQGKNANKTLHCQTLPLCKILSLQSWEAQRTPPGPELGHAAHQISAGVSVKIPGQARTPRMRGQVMMNLGVAGGRQERQLTHDKFNKP